MKRSWLIRTNVSELVVLSFASLHSKHVDIHGLVEVLDVLIAQANAAAGDSRADRPGLRSAMNPVQCVAKI